MIDFVPMAGLEPARAFKSPTDFKSVASAISPHRRDCHGILQVFCKDTKMNSIPERVFENELTLTPQIE